MQVSFYTFLSLVLGYRLSEIPLAPLSVFLSINVCKRRIIIFRRVTDHGLESTYSLQGKHDTP